jgi:hypothetical protein
MHPAPNYRFTLEEVASVISVLNIQNLTCNLSLPSRGEVWRSVNDQLSTHLRTFNIDFVSCPVPGDDTVSSDPYFQSPMILIAPRSARQADSRRFLQTDLVGGDFKVPNLVSYANKVTNPSAGDDRPLLFFGTYRLYIVLERIAQNVSQSPPIPKSLGPSSGREHTAPVFSMEDLAQSPSDLAYHDQQRWTLYRNLSWTGIYRIQPMLHHINV